LIGSTSDIGSAMRCGNMPDAITPRIDDAATTTAEHGDAHGRGRGFFRTSSACATRSSGSAAGE
jgi:hypothetical protein